MEEPETMPTSSSYHHQRSFQRQSSKPRVVTWADDDDSVSTFHSTADRWQRGEEGGRGFFSSIVHDVSDGVRDLEDHYMNTHRDSSGINDDNRGDYNNGSGAGVSIWIGDAKLTLRLPRVMCSGNYGDRTSITENAAYFEEEEDETLDSYMYSYTLNTNDAEPKGRFTYADERQDRSSNQRNRSMERSRASESARFSNVRSTNEQTRGDSAGGNGVSKLKSSIRMLGRKVPTRRKHRIDTTIHEDVVCTDFGNESNGDFVTRDGPASATAEPEPSNCTVHQVVESLKEAAQQLNLSITEQQVKNIEESVLIVKAKIDAEVEALKTSFRQESEKLSNETKKAAENTEKAATAAAALAEEKINYAEEQMYQANEYLLSFAPKSGPIGTDSFKGKTIAEPSVVVAPSPRSDVDGDKALAETKSIEIDEIIIMAHQAGIEVEVERHEDNRDEDDIVESTTLNISGWKALPDLDDTVEEKPGKQDLSRPHTSMPPIAAEEPPTKELPTKETKEKATKEEQPATADGAHHTIVATEGDDNKGEERAFHNDIVQPESNEWILEPNMFITANDDFIEVECDVESLDLGLELHMEPLILLDALLDGSVELKLSEDILYSFDHDDHHDKDIGNEVVSEET